jgi:hypothetical protein
MPVTARDVLGPKDLNSRYFDCLLHLPREPYTVLTLRDANWSHRGRWHLSGSMHGLAEDRFDLAMSDGCQILYQDGSRESVDFYLVKGNPIYQVTEVHGRFGVFIKGVPRYPRGKSEERQAGVEVTTRLVPELHQLLTKYLGEIDMQRRTWLVEQLQALRDREVAASSARLARQCADTLDRLNDLKIRVGEAVQDWHEGDAHDEVFDRIQKLLHADGS